MVNLHNPKHWNSTASLLAERTEWFVWAHPTNSGTAMFQLLPSAKDCILTYNIALMLNLVGNVQSHQDGDMRMHWVGLMVIQQTWGCNIQGGTHMRYICTSAGSDMSMTDPLLSSLSRASFSSLVLAQMKEKSGIKWSPTKGHNNSITYNFARQCTITLESRVKEQNINISVINLN